MKRTQGIKAYLVAAAGSLGMAGIAHAQNVDWSSTDATFPPGASQNWTIGTNWVGDSAPTAASTARIISDGGVALVDSSVTVAQFIMGLNANANGNGLCIDDGGTLNVTLNNTNAFGFRLWNNGPDVRVAVAANGTLSVLNSGIQVGSATSGAILPSTFTSAGTVNASFAQVQRDSVYSMTGGTLTLSRNFEALTVGRPQGTSTTSTTEGLFSHTGGAISATNGGSLRLAGGGTYEISGGSILMSNTTTGLYFRGTDDMTSPGGTIRVIGSGASSISFGGLRYYNLNGVNTYDQDNAKWSFVLDNSANHITTINFTGNGHAAGNLRRGTLEVGLKGGVLLSATSTYDLITAPTINAGTDFIAGPGPLWTPGLTDAATDTVTVSLAGAANKGALDVNGVTSISFAGSNYGYVDLANVTGSSLPVFLDIDGGTLANFTNALTAAGIAWTTAGLPVGYELGLTNLDPSVSGGTSFAWDMGQIDSAMNIQGVSIAIPEPSCVALLVIGGAVMLRRARSTC